MPFEAAPREVANDVGERVGFFVPLDAPRVGDGATRAFDNCRTCWRRRRLDDLCREIRKREELAMPLEQKLRWKDHRVRGEQKLTRDLSPLGLRAPRQVPRLLQAAMAAIEVLRVEAEARGRLLQQMGPGPEQREVRDADP